jgi:hypothetical protein
MTVELDAGGRWSAERAAAWAKAQPWRCGCNFLPSSAVNFLEMWHGQSFDPVTIERELGWAAGIGLNAVRTNLPFLVWRHDRAGLLARIERFLEIADAQGIATVLCLFDDCGFGGEEPVFGPQPDPIPGVHNSRAVASPGRALVMDRDSWPEFERYVRDVIESFREDPRVLFWDLYNEPGNGMVFTPDGLLDVAAELEAHSHALMLQTFRWARSVVPAQPLTVAAWRTSATEADESYASLIDMDALALSDVLSFHAYLPTQRTERIIASLRRRGRPIFCTEWMARAVTSRIADQLALMRRHDVGCFHWGLVRGRTQTHLPWPDALLGGSSHDGVTWFHDLLEPDGSPHDPDEIALLRALSSGSAGA